MHFALKINKAKNPSRTSFEYSDVICRLVIRIIYTMSLASDCDSTCSSITLGEPAQDKDSGMTSPVISAAVRSERLTRPRHTARVA